MDRLALLSGDDGAARLSRFWGKVQLSGECWVWTAATAAGGYGVFKLARGVTSTAHRISLALATGRDPDGLEAGHLCGNVRCVRPDHLEWQTRAENESSKGRVLRPFAKNVPTHESAQEGLMADVCCPDDDEPKRPTENNGGKPSLSHRRSRTVVVEVKRRRRLSTPEGEG